MKKINIDPKILHNIEIELNEFKYKDLELGTLLSYYFDRIYRGDFNDNIFRQFLKLTYYLIKYKYNKDYLKNFKKSIIYFKSGECRHLNEIKCSITDNPKLKELALIIGLNNNADINMIKLLSLLNIKDIYNICKFTFINIKYIINIFSTICSNKITITILLYCMVLQLLKAYSLKKFILIQKNTFLIGADFDRGRESSLFFAVSKALKINSFTIQHGVLNPPVGYSPVNANEIWVWGEMAKKQLLQLGVTPSKIRITGTPIVQNIKRSDKIKQILVQKYQLKPGKNIVLALSSPNKPNDIKLVEFFSAIKKEYANSFDNYMVKIHPARNYEEFRWIKNIYKIDLLPHDIPYQDFINIVDILLSHTSGIAAEVLYYNKKVGILDILDESPGNGLELNKYFNVPLIKHISTFYNDLYYKEIPNIGKTLFYKVGDEAKMEIQEIIIKQIVKENESA